VVAAIFLAMGFVPFFWLWRSGLRVGETPTASAGRRSRALLGSLVIGQVAIALVLLVGAGLLIHSFARVMAVNPGFDAARVVGGRIALPLVRYKDPKDNVAVQQRILAGMKAIPGVETACLVGDYAISPSFRLGPFLLRGSETAAGQGQPMIFLNVVSPEFFATMGIRLLDGRPFRDDDVVTKDPVVIVDQTFAERYFPGRSVVGQEIVGGTTPPPAGKPWARIAGVVARANLTGLEGRDSWPFVYVPINQTPMAGFSVLLRTSRPEADVIAGMRAQLRTIDSTLPLYSTGSVARGLDDMLAKRRSLTSLLGLFAGLALILAAVGLYGVLNYDVSQRTREIGIRGAIGATRAQIVSLILGQGMRKTVLGLVAGLAGAVFLTRFLRKLLFEITPADPTAYLAVTALLLLVALLASWLPARRAAKVDPVIALRTE
jgi:predicted permease